MRLRAVLTLLALTAVAPSAQQPAAPSATVVLRGVVTTANDVPLPRVRVAPAVAVLPQMAMLGVRPEAARGVLTDDRGQFTIRVPSTATLRLAFVKARYTAFTAEVSPRDLAAQDSDIRVRMSLAGAISGLVLDRSGGRLISATVLLLPTGAGASDTPLATTRTNDLGEYRFGGLTPGRYVVAARSSVFALGADVPDREAIVNAAGVRAPAVDVSAGADLGNVDLTIDAPSEIDQDARAQREVDPAGTASLSGRVVGIDGIPVGRAVVHAYRPYVSGRQVETDARGRYRIDGLGPGEYTVEARKYGFDTRQYGQSRGAARGRPVVLTDGQVVDSIDVTITRGGAIAGTIVDEFGEPMQDLPVTALQLQAAGGRTRGLRASVSGGSRTDDRGQYRIFGLQPGAYLVQALVGDSLSAASGYLPLFHPGTLSIDQATPTKIDFGAVVSGLDFMLVPTAAHRVTGNVVDSNGQPARGEALLAVSERSGAIQTQYVRVEITADGSFEFANVGPGEYVVQVNGSIVNKDTGRSAWPEFAMAYVTVTTADPPPVQLRLAPGATVMGRVRYEGVPAGPTPLLTIAAIPADRDRGPLRGYNPNGFSIRPDGSFQFTGVFGPAVFQAQPQRSDWYLKSVVLKGQDLTDAPFDFGTGGTFRDVEVLISAFGATASGRVTDDRSVPVRDSSVVVFSTFRDRWFPGSRWVKSGRSSQAGTFTVTGLPPGDYWIAATGPEGSAGRGLIVADPGLLESLESRATRISLSEGQTLDLALRLVSR
jgi:protocatechuate 3,4-dioxygenase beta subunit